VPTEHQEATVSEGWGRIDALIFSERLVQALRTIREQFGPMSLHEAVELLDERFAHLRHTRPDEFTVSLDSYGEGFYS
jgi:hypothetical protein